jgi:hemolysin activation/secretion protein
VLSARPSESRVLNTFLRISLTSIALSVAIMLPGMVTAAPAAPAPVTPVLPANTPTPGQVQSTLPTAPAAPQLKGVPAVTTPSTGQAEIAPGGPTVTAQHFEITGDSVFPDAVLQAQIASYLGRPLTLAELYKAADTITKYYQDHGYGIARATVPEQEFSADTVKLEVLEGRLGKVSVEGSTRTRTAVIEKRAADFKSGQVYTDAAMDRSVLLVNDLPGVQAQATLEPGTDFGTADLVYKAQDEPEVSGQLSVDDYGRRDVGLFRFNAEADFASLTGSGDHLSANITHSEANLLNFGGLTYVLPVGPPGGMLTTDYNQSEYHVVGAAFDKLEISGTSKNAGVSYQYPSLRGRLENFYWGLGFQHAGTATAAKGVTVSQSNLNTAQFTFYYTKSHVDGGYYSLNGTFTSNGRKDYGTTPDAERARLELDGSYVQPFAGSWSLVTKATGAWSPDPLPDTEKYALGGPDNVRGFLSSEQRGDSGLFASGEITRSFGPDLPFSLGGFLDSGRVWLKKFDTAALDEKTHEKVEVPTPGAAETLTATGLEFVMQPASKRWQARVQWAYAIGGYKPSDGNNGGHIWVSLGMNFGGAVATN